MVNASPTIGRVAGIDVQLHWTFILLMLFALLLSLYIFVIFVLLFACVFLHELAHSITAKRNGIRVKKIVLYPLGGGSIIDLDNVPPALEFKISIAGPISSFLMAFVFGAIAVYMPGGMIKVFVQLLFVLNLLLAVFNILPWFPLDGGRVLRSYLQRRRSFLDATRTSVKVSNALVVLFIVGTVIFVALEPSYSFVYKEFVVLWDAFIAIFLYGAAKSEMQSAYLRAYTSGLKASSSMTKQYVMAKPDTTLARLYPMVVSSRMHIVLFRNGGKYYVVSRLPYNAFGRILEGYGSLPISKFSAQLPLVKYNDTLYTALERMQESNTGVAGVMKGDALVGVLQRQHVESIIALHMSSSNRNPKKA